MWRLSSVQGDSSITLEPPGGVSMAATMDNSFFPASRAMSENVSSTIAMRMADTSPAADGIHQPLYLGSSLRTYQSPDLQTLGSGADREDKGMNRRETHEGWPSGSDSQNSHHAMNNIQHQPHVAQQSRREKLRIPGSLHPSSPQSGNQSDHSAGSASVLDVRQGGTDVQAQQPENFDLPAGSLRGYTGHPNQMGDVLSVYNTNMIASDPYNFPTGAELLAFPSKGSSYLCAASDLMPQTVGGIPTNQSSGAGGYANQPGFFSKSSNWNGIGGQLGQYNPISIVGSNGIPGSSLQNGNSGAPGPIAATLLVGAGHGKDASLAFSGPNADAMQIYLMNNNYTGYSDGSTPGNMVLISPSSGASQGNQGTSGQAQQHFIGIPLTPPTTSQSSVANVSSVGNALPANFFSRVGGQAYNWRPGDELMFLPGSEATQRAKSMDQTGSSIGLSQLALAEMSEYGMRQSPLSSMLAQQQPLVQPGHALDMENSQNAAPGYGQSLSLSLSSQHPPSMPLHGVDVHQSGLNPSQDAKRSGQIVNKFASDLSHFRSPGREALAGSNFANMAHSGGAKQFYYDANSSPISSSFNFVSGSKFLKAAQQLLDENCNVGRGLKPRSMKHQNSGAWGSPNPAITSSFHREASTVEGGLKDGISSGSTIAQNGSQSVAQSTANENNETTAMLSPEERHEFEGKKTKLLAMLQEVDRRYRHYYEQMQVVIASFDSVAGAGAATPYTALALQAMSRYFRCLRDAITTQIQSTCKALGEEDITKQLTSRAPTSRLRFVDQQLRQQRAAFQQLGMLPQNAWRPQRGLPERSVSILRAWLFEHFLHPYPKDQDKIMLAKQTGLSRSQVSNWFINARVRLWKPMVEEMYQEEAREQTETGSGKVSGDGEEYHEGSGDIGTGEKTSKSDSRQEQSTGMIMSDNKLQGTSDLQKPLNGSMHTSDYVVNSSIRKTSQEVDSQVYDGGQQDGTKQGQSKKSRVGGHESDVLLPPNGDMDMDIKTDLSAVNDTDHKFSSQEREQFGIIQTADGRCFGSFEDRNFARFGNGFSSNYPGSGGGVTLTLGLRHSDNLHQQAYIGQMRADIDPGHGEYCGIYGNASMNATHISEHDSLDYQSRKHMETQLMHDFVA